MAGVRFLQELRALDRSWRVTAFDRDPWLPYDRVRLSGLLTGGLEAGALALKPRSWYEANAIELHTGCGVRALEPGAGRLLDDRGRWHAFEHCVIATGSDPVRLHPGAAPEGGATFRTLDDALALSRSAGPAVVVGGGLLGLEVARGLQLRGMPVTVVHRSSWLMGNQLDRTGARLLQERLREQGIGFLLDTTVEVFRGDRGVEAVRLSSGAELPAALVVTCAGTSPASGLAAAAGIRVGRGILVDDGLRTSAANVSAIGECTEHRGRTIGLIPPANAHAAVLARRLTGDESAAYVPPVETATLKVAGVGVFSAGPPAVAAGDRVERVHDEVRGTYQRLVYRDRRLVGAILVGDLRAHGVVMDALQRQGPPADRRALLGGSPGPVALDEQSLKTMVCGCGRVSRAHVVEVVRGTDGPADAAEVLRRTGAGRSCGACVGAVEALVAAAQRSGLPRDAALCACLPLSAGALRKRALADRVRSPAEALRRYGDGIGCRRCRPRIGAQLERAWRTVRA
jgi:nitrite reductase (NADH) large subunit